MRTEVSARPRPQGGGRVRISPWVWAMLSCIGAGLVGCKHEDKAAAMKPPARPPALVSVAEATTRDVPVYIDQIGRTVAVQMVAIVPQVGGKIIATHVEHGDYVKKGQLLFEIDPRPFAATLASAKATVAQSQAELDLARMELSRVSEALEAAAVSKLEHDQKKSGVAMAEAKLAAAEAAVESAQLDLEFSRIHSPIDGKAGVRQVDAGNIVRANGEPLLMIQQMSPIYAEFTVTENDLGAVRRFLTAAQGSKPLNAREQGLSVLVDVPADSARVLGALGGAAGPATRPVEMTESPATQPGERGPREGTLMFLDNSVQDQTGTIRLRAELPNEDRYFWPGQFVNVRLILTRKENAVLVPTQARQIGQQGPFVYVVTGDGTAEQRPIVPGQRHGSLLVVDQGVQPGEKVVISGHAAVSPGGKVRVMNGSGVPASAPQTQHAEAR